MARETVVLRGTRIRWWIDEGDIKSELSQIQSTTLLHNQRQWPWSFPSSLSQLSLLLLVPIPVTWLRRLLLERESSRRKLDRTTDPTTEDPTEDRTEVRPMATSFQLGINVSGPKTMTTSAATARPRRDWITGSVFGICLNNILFASPANPVLLAMTVPTVWFHPDWTNPYVFWMIVVTS